VKAAKEQKPLALVASGTVLSPTSSLTSASIDVLKATSAWMASAPSVIHHAPFVLEHLMVALLVMEQVVPNSFTKRSVTLTVPLVQAPTPKL
jgi:hypothetical protein